MVGQFYKQRQHSLGSQSPAQSGTTSTACLLPFREEYPICMSGIKLWHALGWEPCKAKSSWYGGNPGRLPLNPKWNCGPVASRMSSSSWLTILCIGPVQVSPLLGQNGPRNWRVAFTVWFANSHLPTHPCQKRNSRSRESKAPLKDSLYSRNHDFFPICPSSNDNAFQ